MSSVWQTTVPGGVIGYGSNGQQVTIVDSNLAATYAAAGAAWDNNIYQRTENGNGYFAPNVGPNVGASTVNTTLTDSSTVLKQLNPGWLNLITGGQLTIVSG